MITPQEFDFALRIIVDYKKQLENVIYKTSLKIDIRKDIDRVTFGAIQRYYKEEFDIDLKLSDLNEMDIELLKSINFKKLRYYRGFGKVAEFRFKKLLESYSVH